MYSQRTPMPVISSQIAFLKRLAFTHNSVWCLRLLLATELSHLHCRDMVPGTPQRRESPQMVLLSVLLSEGKGEDVAWARNEE